MYNENDMEFINRMRKKPVANNKRIGSNIRRRRREMGYTQSQLANYLGVEASQISNLENGSSSTNASTIIALAQIMQCSVDCFYSTEYDYPFIKDSLQEKEESIDTEILKKLQSYDFRTKMRYLKILDIISPHA